MSVILDLNEEKKKRVVEPEQDLLKEFSKKFSWKRGIRKNLNV